MNETSAADEEQFIPFDLVSLVGHSAIVFAPHPDDETFGCGGTIALHRQYGDNVKVIIMTDGAKAQAKDDLRSANDYIALRQSESVNACRVLGTADVTFWGEPDRGLICSDELIEKARAAIEACQPDLVYAPSLHEFHPDHRACAEIVWNAMSRISHPGRLALYEVNRPFKVNALVDISTVVEKKKQACAAYQSQEEIVPYADISLALNRFRSLTVANKAQYVEAFEIISSADIVGTNIETWLRDQFQSETWSLSPAKEQTHAKADSNDGKNLKPPTASKNPSHVSGNVKRRRRSPSADKNQPLVSIVIRTKNRPVQLAEALRTVCAQTYTNIEVVIVNDGGVPIDHVLDEFLTKLEVQIVCNRRSYGRSKAANIGVKKSSGHYICFLDDDDLLYPIHIETLVQEIENTDQEIAYTGVHLSIHDHVGDKYIATGKQETFPQVEFTREAILTDNFIPIMSVLMTRQAFDSVGGFDEEFDHFEDWDLWIRLSENHHFHKISEISCEYRLLNDRLTVEARDRTIAARRAIYAKHAEHWSRDRLVEYAWYHINRLEAAARQQEAIVDELTEKNRQYLEEEEARQKLQASTLKKAVRLVKGSAEKKK